MKTILELSKAEIESAIKEYFKNQHTMFEADKISFNVSNVANERESGSRYELVSAIVTIKSR